MKNNNPAEVANDEHALDLSEEENPRGRPSALKI